MNIIRLMTVLFVILAIAACNKPASDPAEKATEAAPVAATENPNAESVEIVPGLDMRILREGDGAVAESGQIAVVHYTGWLYDESAVDKRGTKFDSSVDRGQHFQFPLGAGRVIRGWDQGVVGMKEGEKRELTIAPEMAYGERGAGAVIPPGSTLVFEVELARVQSTTPEVSLPTSPDGQ